MYANKSYLIDVPPRHYWHLLPKFNILEITDVPCSRPLRVDLLSVFYMPVDCQILDVSLLP